MFGTDYAKENSIPVFPTYTTDDCAKSEFIDR